MGCLLFSPCSIVGYFWVVFPLVIFSLIIRFSSEGFDCKGVIFREDDSLLGQLKLFVPATWLSRLCVYCSGRSLRFKHLRFCAVYARTFSWCGLVMRMTLKRFFCWGHPVRSKHTILFFLLQVQEVLELDLVRGR